VAEDEYEQFQRRIVAAEKEAKELRLPRHRQIIPRGGQRKKEPLRPEMRHRQKVLRPAIRPRGAGARKISGERAVTENLQTLRTILQDIKHLRTVAGKRFAYEKHPVTEAMAKQSSWLTAYEAGIVARASMLKKYRRSLASKKSEKKPEYQIKRLEKKIDKIENYATPFNTVYHDFKETRKEFGNCLCPPQGQTLDAWIRENATELGLGCVAREMPRHRGAATLAERRRLAELKMREQLGARVPPTSPLARQMEIDRFRLQRRQVEDRLERLERLQRLQG